MERPLDLKELEELWHEVRLDCADVVGFALSVSLLARAFQEGQLDQANFICSLSVISNLLYDDSDRMRFGIEKINPVISRFISGDHCDSVGDPT